MRGAGSDRAATGPGGSPVVVPGWSVEHRSGTAQALHDRPFRDVTGPTAWVLTPARRALVLGSSQSDALVDPVRAEASGVEVCRRRSGGGIVLLDPASSVWIDVVVPVDGRGPTSGPASLFRWVGDVWLRALRRVGIGGLTTHEGRATGRDPARLLCFAGFGTGEVVQHTVDGPSKVVGLSQRRTSTAARVQGLFVTGWDPALLRHLVRPDAWPTAFDPADVRVGVRERPLPAPGEVVDAVLTCLPGGDTTGAP